MDLTVPEAPEAGQHVISRDEREQGALTGGERHCGARECPGRRVRVRWPDGGCTWPCTAALGWDPERKMWRIL